LKSVAFLAMAAELDDVGDMGLNFAEDLERFAEDSFIQAALGQGVDLRGYSRQIETELREASTLANRSFVISLGTGKFRSLLKGPH
jgi:hypothetical protein